MRHGDGPALGPRAGHRAGAVGGETTAARRCNHGALCNRVRACASQFPVIAVNLAAMTIQRLARGMAGRARVARLRAPAMAASAAVAAAAAAASARPHHRSLYERFPGRILGARRSLRRLPSEM